MNSERPRLLVTIRPRPDLRESLDRLLPAIPWGFLEETPPSARGDVEALLIASFARDSGPFDPATTPKLAFVQRLYTGLDGFPFSKFPERVRVAGNVGAMAPYVSEHAITLALAAAHDLYAAREMVRTGQLRPPPVQRLLYRTTAVVLGYGEIGRAIARRLSGFEVRVVGVNRSGAPVEGADEIFPAERIREALALGDFVFEARPLTRRTAGTIGAAELAAMRPHAVFVNVGRAGTVDEAALFHHLETHPEFRAAIDVWWNEDYRGGTLFGKFPFTSLPNFVGTPHSAGVAPGEEAHVLERAAENLARFFRGDEPRYVVDRTEYSG